MNEYTVNGTGFDSYFAAIKYANAIRANVIDGATGRVIWTPAPAVSATKTRRYERQLAAYTAYKNSR